MKKMIIKRKSQFIRIFLIITGFISVILGIIGIVLPVLPTTPFLLLAAICFSKSSDKFYFWLLNNRIFGKYIKNYREKRGITIKAKLMVLFFLWLTISTSALYAVNNLHVKILLFVIAIGVTTHILYIKTLEE